MGLDSAEKVRARCPARQGPGPGPESFVGGELPAQAIRVTSPAVTLTLAESDRDRDCQSDSEALTETGQTETKPTVTERNLKSRHSNSDRRTAGPGRVPAGPGLARGPSVCQ